jgi:hypothetical protein
MIKNKICKNDMPNTSYRLDTEKLLPALSAGSGFKLRSNTRDKK